MKYLHVCMDVISSFYKPSSICRNTGCRCQVNSMNIERHNAVNVMLWWNISIYSNVFASVLYHGIFLLPTCIINYFKMRINYDQIQHLTLSNGVFFCEGDGRPNALWNYVRTHRCSLETPSLYCLDLHFLNFLSTHYFISIS